MIILRDIVILIKRHKLKNQVLLNLNLKRIVLKVKSEAQKEDASKKRNQVLLSFSSTSEEVPRYLFSVVQAYVVK